ncbi:MAG: hypothetical protein IJR07_09050 [Bacteroidaceae bacterium]|nr:hypothetical protein [Bacteroidaceae bacterium]
MRKRSRWVLAAILFCSLSVFTGCTTDNDDSPVVNEFDAKKYALVDLHLHLDGSLSVDDVIYMASVDAVPVCINTDNMSVSNTTVQKELQKLYDAGVLTAAQAELMVRNAITHAFLSDEERSALLSKIK